MVVHSEPLINALRTAPGHLGHIKFKKRTAIINAPCAASLIPRYQALRLYRIVQPQCHSKDYATTTVKHIDVLLEFLEKKFGRALANASTRHQNKTTVTRFDWLPDVFRPGEIVYYRVHNGWKPAILEVVQKVIGDPLAPIRIICWNVHFSGGRMTRLHRHICIRYFNGEQGIDNLDVIPAGCFQSDAEEMTEADIVEKNILMGKRYWELVKQPAYKECNGEIFSQINMENPSGRVSGHLSKQRIHMGTTCANKVLDSVSSYSRRVGDDIASGHGVTHDAILQPYSSDSGRFRSHTTAAAWHEWTKRSTRSSDCEWQALLL